MTSHDELGGIVNTHKLIRETPEKLLRTYAKRVSSFAVVRKKHKVGYNFLILDSHGSPRCCGVGYAPFLVGAPCASTR